MSAPKRARRNPRCASRGDSDSHGDDGNRIAGVAGVTDGNRHPLLQPSSLPFSRHPRTALHVHAKHGNGQPIRGSLAASAILEEIPEGDYFVATLRVDEIYRSRMTAKEDKH